MCKACWSSLLKSGLSVNEINRLPDEAFAILEPDYKREKTLNKNARHLPHHSKDVKVGRSSYDNLDEELLKSMLLSVNNIEPVTDSISQENLIARARAHLEKHRDEIKLTIEKKEDGSADLTSEIRESLKANGIELISDGCISTRLAGDIVTDVSAMPERKILMDRLAEIESDSISVKDLVPKPEDYFRVEYRALSKTLLPHRFLDFTKEDVLKKSAKMLTGVTFYPDHNAEVQNYLGKVEKSVWDESASPPGINATVLVDVLANLKISRGILGGILTRVSTHLWFDWEKSHDLDSWEFFNLLGTKVEGEIVRLIVTEIKGFGELSLVWYGADPTAKERQKPELKTSD